MIGVTMPKAKKTVARKKPASKGAKRAGKPNVYALLDDMARTIRSQHQLIERLVALHEVSASAAGHPSEPNDTVGSIPRISLVPTRAA